MRIGRQYQIVHRIKWLRMLKFEVDYENFVFIEQFGNAAVPPNLIEIGKQDKGPSINDVTLLRGGRGIFRPSMTRHTNSLENV